MARIGIFGWGVVAPRSPDVETFAANLETSDTWLTPFDGFGPSNFLVGQPDFDLERYKGWIDERFPPGKFPQLRQKMGTTPQFAIGAFIQSLSQNPGIEAVLQELGAEAQVIVGTGLGELPTYYDASVEYHRAARRWAKFWADPMRNSDRARFDAANDLECGHLREEWEVPEEPASAVTDAAAEATYDEWIDFWMGRSDGLAEFLERLEAIESVGVTGDVQAGKLNVIRRKRTDTQKLIAEYGCPTPPWLSVTANVLWNIHNTPAAQISMLGKITGPTYAPVAACSTFGVALHLATRAIRTGEAKAVVVGTADPEPHPITVGTFYAARVLAGDSSPSLPLTDLRGTHVSGGSCVWIVADRDFMEERGFSPMGLEILGVGVTSDADHIITPTPEGPLEAARRALADAGIESDAIGTWDLHATATPGDASEVSNLQELLPESVLVTARKGTFGHGMSCCGGWELMAQHLGIVAGRLHPTPLNAEALNATIAEVGYDFVLDQGCDAPAGAAGKLSMGVGGINACVISRPW
ncbi:MAG: beta-ketoacyl synthase [Acidobacteria bacterium]|nr:beta-ketoacyl synthase [Acidobacteriota bacterium]